MKTKTTKIISVILACVMIASMFTYAVSAGSSETLNSLGLFLGTDDGYELDRAPTRAEAAVMLVRLLGKEAEVKETNFEHPFIDVPEWASSYVGYLYENKIADGINYNEFGSDDKCYAYTFCTFILNALGYVDGKDFNYDGVVESATESGLMEFVDEVGAIEFATSLGLLSNDLIYRLEDHQYLFDYYYKDYPLDGKMHAYITDEETGEQRLITEEEAVAIIEEDEEINGFKRSDCVDIMYKALNTNIKGTETTLLEKLASENAVNTEAAGKIIAQNALLEEFGTALQSALMATMAAAMEQPVVVDFDFVLAAPEATFEDILDMLEKEGMTYEDIMAQLEAEGYTMADIQDLMEEYNSLTSSLNITANAKITVVGEEFALELKINYMDEPIDITVYYTDGYIYAEYDSEKVKFSVADILEDYADIINIGSLEDYENFENLEDFDGSMDYSVDDILSQMDISDYLGELPLDLFEIDFGSIEKMVSDNIIYKIKTKIDAMGSYIDGEMTTVLTLDGLFESVSIQAKTLSDYSKMDIKLDLKITFPGDITIEFPDFSDYVDYNEIDYSGDNGTGGELTVEEVGEDTTELNTEDNAEETGTGNSEEE